MDYYCKHGEVFGIKIFGIQKMGKSVLMLASFKRTVDHQLNTFVKGRIDRLKE
jgi:DNA-directed RNA polymerase III subunit RPC1